MGDQLGGDVNAALLIACLVLLVAVLAVRLAARTGLPSLLLYLAVGVAIGEGGLGIEFENYELTSQIGFVALAIILAEGGLTTRWRDVQPILPFAAVLATLGVAVSVAVVAAAAVLLIGADVRTALLLGAVIASTDAAAVFSVLRRLPIRGRVRAVLEAESGLNDAPAIVLVTLLASDAWNTGSVLGSVGLVVYELLAGAVIGLAVGRVGAAVLARVALPAAGLYPLATVAFALLADTAAVAVHASGFLAVYLAGLVIGNAMLPHRRSVLGFASSLALLAEAGLFVLLGLLVSPDRLPSALLPALVVGAAATLLARPLSVLICALPFRLPLREQTFLAWAGLRGAVPIVLATIPVTQGVPGSERIVDVVFLLVVVYTLVQAPTLPWVGRRLGVAEAGLAHELEVESAPLDELRAELLQLTIPRGSRLAGLYVEELRLPREARVTLIVRDGATIVPDRYTVFAPGDSVLLVTTTAVRDEAERRLRTVSYGGRLARWNRAG